MRKFIIGLVGAAVLAVLSIPAMPTDASARGWHRHHGWHGGWRGGYYGGRGYYGYPYYAGYAYYPYYSYSCWRNARVWTPYGFMWRRVWVCG